MPYLCAGIIFFYPLIASSLTLDQKVNLKLIESLWQEQQYEQAEEQINKFLSKYETSECDDSLLKLKADLLIKKKDYAQALAILDHISEKSNFTYERQALCLYELKQYDRFISLFEENPELHNLALGKKIWDVGLSEAIASEQNLDRKQKLIEKATHLYETTLQDDFDESRMLSHAILQENNKDYQKAFKLYEELFTHTKQESYQLSMARMLSHFNPKKAIDVLETLRWKSGTLGSSAAMFAMQIMDQNEDFHHLYTLSLEELKIAPEGFRKAKIALYHLKSLFYLKIFDRVSDFYFAYNPHKFLKSQDLQLAVTLISKTFLIRNEILELERFYKSLQNDSIKDAQVTAGRILAKNYLEHQDYQKAQNILNDLHKIDVLHTDEYLTTLGFCYLNTQAFEVAENYFLKVLTDSPDLKTRLRAINYLVDIPKTVGLTLDHLIKIENDIVTKDSPKVVLWLAENYKILNDDNKALALLNCLEEKQNYKYHHIMGELLEKKSLSESIVHFEKALVLAQKNEQKAYFHNKLFVSYFEHDKEKAIDHLFNSINMHNVAIPDNLFEGLASYLYQQATMGIRLYIGDKLCHEKASKLLRLLSYKKPLHDSENIICAKLLRKLCRFEEALKVLEGKNNLEEKLELARVYNQQGDYQKCDHILSELLKIKPYTLFLEGQKTLLTKICLHYDRLEALSTQENIKDQLEKELRVLSVCIQDAKQPIAFEVDLVRHLFFKKENDDLERLRFHPFLTSSDTGAYRKIINYIINNKIDIQSAQSIEDNISDTMEWILIKLFRSKSCLR